MKPKRLTLEGLKLIAQQFRVLGEPTRLQLLNELREGESSVGQLVKATGLNQANVSKQLKVLLKNEIVARERRGQSVFYRISDPIILDLCELMCEKLRDHFEKHPRKCLE